MSHMSQSCAYALMVAVTAVAATAIHAEVDTGTYTYDGALPTVTGDEFTETTIPTWVTDSEKFQGTIWLKNITTVTDFTVNTYGNESSKVKLTNISGWLRAPGNYAFENTVPVEIDGTLTLNNGNSANDGNPNRCTVFKKVSGSGTINTTATADHVVVVIQDATEFTGSLGLNEGKYIVFGQAMPDYTTILSQTTIGTIFVMPDAKVTNSGFWWATGGMQVYGELCASGLDKFGGGTTITTSDTGTFTLTSTSDINDSETDYARIKGTGTLKFESDGKFFRALSQINFPTNMTLVAEVENGLVFTLANATNTIGSLSGSKNLRSDWGSGNRYVRILQAKDTTWSGVFFEDRIDSVIVAPGISSVGTLTLSGTQTVDNKLVVEAGAKANLTGAWVGATTVAGTLGGTGTITGDLTLTDGAILNIVDLDTPLKVSGNLSAAGTIEVHLPAIADVTHLKTILSATGTIDVNNATFLVTSIGGEAQDSAPYSVKPGRKRLYVMGNHGNRIIFR